MQQAPDLASFIAAPAGRWMVAGKSLVWAHSPTLIGSISWGTQTERETEEVMRVFDGYVHLAPKFDLILDGRLMDRVDPAAMLVFLDWTRRHFFELRARLGRGVGVFPDGVTGLILAGMAPMLGGLFPVKICGDPLEAARFVLPTGGDALWQELNAIVNQARGLKPILLQLRPLLLLRRGRLSVGDAARELGLSSRSLQRELQLAGSSYRAEQQDARFRCAEQLLGGNDKIASVAAQLGLGEGSLTTLVRAYTGLTPGELRLRLKAV